MSSSLYTWAVFKHGKHMETSSLSSLLSLQTRVGREIVRYKSERKEEMRKERGGEEELLV
jgi:hypothetical protein